MLVAIGYVVVIVSVFGGFAMAGGHLGSLFQPVELIMIAGAALGAFFVGNSGKAIKATFKALPYIFRDANYTKAVYMELMTLLYEILGKIRKEGLMSIEADVDDPGKSPLFGKYPKILSDHHATEFITDYLRLMVGGNLNPLEIENLMDGEIETHHQEGEVPVHVISKMGDALPAFGIVAAVMGGIEDVQLKEGRAGPLVFVKVRHEISAEGQLAITEEQDIVYREMPQPDTAAPAGTAAPEDAAWTRRIEPDPVLLFRYSALTLNGHRIHYDRTYATEAEGYPGLVVHGPLIATLLLDLLRRELPGREVAAFSFKAVSPIFDIASFEVCGCLRDEQHARLWARTAAGHLAMEASATLA